MSTAFRDRPGRLTDAWKGKAAEGVGLAFLYLVVWRIAFRLSSFFMMECYRFNHNNPIILH